MFLLLKMSSLSLHTFSFTSHKKLSGNRHIGCVKYITNYIRRERNANLLFQNNWVQIASYQVWILHKYGLTDWDFVRRTLFDSIHYSSYHKLIGSFKETSLLMLKVSSFDSHFFKREIKTLFVECTFIVFYQSIWVKGLLLDKTTRASMQLAKK